MPTSALTKDRALLGMSGVIGILAFLLVTKTCCDCPQYEEQGELMVDTNRKSVTIAGQQLKPDTQYVATEKELAEFIFGRSVLNDKSDNQKKNAVKDDAMVEAHGENTSVPVRTDSICDSLKMVRVGRDTVGDKQVSIFAEWEVYGYPKKLKLQWQLSPVIAPPPLRRWHWYLNGKTYHRDGLQLRGGGIGLLGGRKNLFGFAFARIDTASYFNLQYVIQLK